MTSTPLISSAQAGPRVAAEPAWKDGLIAFVVGTLLYALSCWIQAPSDVAKGFGEQWLEISKDPRLLPSMFPHRLLAPLLAWLLGLGGPHYLAFVRCLGVLLLMTVWFFGRRRGLGLLDATLLTAAIALTAPIQLYKDHWVGYPDPLCYALFLLCAMVARWPVLFWSLWLLNLTNHELAVFLLPWLWFVRREAGGRVAHDVVGAGAALGAYAGYYLWIKAHSQPLFTYEYFASHPLFPGGSFVVLCLAMVHLVVAWGPVLGVLAWHQHTRGSGRERWHLWLVGLGILVIFCIAFDWARHSNLILIPFVLASVRFLQAGHRLAFTALLALGVGLMLWIPPWSPNAWPTEAVANLNLLVGSGVANVHAPRFAGDFNVTFGPLSVALQNWLPQVWKMLLVIAGIGAAIWGFGAWLAMRDRSRGNAET